MPPQSRKKPQPQGDELPMAERGLENLIGYNLKRAYVIVRGDFRATMGEDGMSPRVFSALSFVVDMPDITQSELARRLGIERSGLVAIVDDLEGRGYLRRTAVPGDRRVQALRPTQVGVEAFAEAIAQAEAHEARLLQVMSEDEKAQLLALLRAIREPGEADAI